jgi:hypothetical protein
MSTGIAEPADGRLRAALTAALRARGSAAPLRRCRTGGRWDLLLCASAASLPPGSEARLLIVSADCAGAAARRCRAGTVMTCGLDPRCTLTPSALLDDGLAALRRELPLPDGRLLLPCETALWPAGPAAHRLLMTAALLVLGA